MRVLRLTYTLLACLAVALSAASAAAASSPSVLTKAEYQQLQLAQKRIHSLESSDARSFAKANAVCTRHARASAR